MKKIEGSIMMLLFILLATAGMASADMIYTNAGEFYSNTGGIGYGRGILILADEDFSISRLGIYGDFTASQYDMDIFASSGPENKGALLASASVSVDGTGGSTYCMFDLNFNFTAGSYYFINFTRSDNGWIYTSMNYYLDGSLPLDYGPFTLLDGTHGVEPSWSNTVHCEFAFNTTATSVPEPVSLVLFLTGLMAIGWTRRRVGR